MYYMFHGVVVFNLPVSFVISIS